MNAPANLLQGVEHQTLVKFKSVTAEFLIESYYLPSVLLLLTHCSLIKNPNTTPKELAAFLFGINVIVWTVLVVEFSQLQEVYYRSTETYGAVASPTIHNGTVRESTVWVARVNEDLPVHQLKMLVTFLKFWHVLFIATFAAFVTIRLVEYRKLSFDVIAATYQNFAYLLVFNSMALTFLMKKTVFVYATRIPNTFVSQHPTNLMQTTISFYLDIFNQLIIMAPAHTIPVTLAVGLVIVGTFTMRRQNKMPYQKLTVR